MPLVSLFFACVSSAASRQITPYGWCSWCAVSGHGFGKVSSNKLVGPLIHLRSLVEELHPAANSSGGRVAWASSDVWWSAYSSTLFTFFPHGSDAIWEAFRIQQGVCVMLNSGTSWLWCWDERIIPSGWIPGGVVLATLLNTKKWRKNALQPKFSIRVLIVKMLNRAVIFNGPLCKRYSDDFP
jgi:hypothetical protein